MSPRFTGSIARLRSIARAAPLVGDVQLMAEDARRVLLDLDALLALLPALQRVARMAQHERAVRASWLSTLPACAKAPEGLLSAERATAHALDLLDDLGGLGTEPYRTSPPSPREVFLQYALKRGWRVEDIHGTVQHLRGHSLNPRFLDGTVPLRWTPEDAERRACRWPS